MTKPKPPDHRNAPFALWRRACVFVVELVQRFGLPQELAARRTLSFTHYKRILPWLRAGEALMRRLLLIEAALLKAPMHARVRVLVSSPACRALAARTKQNRGGSVVAQRAMTMGGGAQPDPKNPASWRVSFRIVVSSPAGGGGTRLHTIIGAPRFRSALPLARRLEALLRIYNNPAPFARRLATRLRKAATLITRIANDAWKKSRHLIGRDLHDVLIAPIEEATRVLADSS